MSEPNQPSAADAPPSDAAAPLTQPVGSESGPSHAVERAGLRPGETPAGAIPASRPLEPKPSFHLPNAKVGLHYCARIDGQDPDGRAIRVLEARIPAGLALSFDPASGELRGTPALDGDHKLALRWTIDGTASYAGDCLLIVNPDPKSLWKVIEPPADAPYPKPHLDSRLLTGDGFRIAAASRRGRSHEHAGTFRDDDFFISLDPDTGWNLILVADGAGSAPFSRQGSRLAVSAAGEYLASNLGGDFGSRMSSALDGWDADPVVAGQAMGAEFHYLFHKAGQLAVQAIEQEAQIQGTAAREYATTLLAAAIKRHDGETFLATFWMGDGAIAAYGPRGKVRLMGTPDGGEFAGQTRFLDRAALDRPGFRQTHRYRPLPGSVRHPADDRRRLRSALRDRQRAERSGQVGQPLG